MQHPTVAELQVCLGRRHPRILSREPDGPALSVGPVSGQNESVVHGPGDAVKRGINRYRTYTDADAESLRLLIGLRRLDVPLEQAAQLTKLCASGRCDEVSAELRTLVAEKRFMLHRQMDELRLLDQRMAHLASQLDRGAGPRSVIGIGKEDEHASAV